MFLLQTSEFITISLQRRSVEILVNYLLAIIVSEIIVITIFFYFHFSIGLHVLKIRNSEKHVYAKYVYVSQCARMSVCHWVSMSVLYHRKVCAQNLTGFHIYQFDYAVSRSYVNFATMHRKKHCNGIFVPFLILYH